MQIFLDNYVLFIFLGLLVFLSTGFPVSFCLAATGLFFGWLSIQLGIFPPDMMQALPLRIFGIMQNDTLLAVPFFTFMGLVLQRSGMAEDLLDTVGQIFGKVRGGVAVAVVFVGALLAATTGVTSASVISMGLISLPVMLRYNYNRSIATGVISASGTLAQIIPPSLVLIVMADQLGRPVGDMYAGALIPALSLVGLFLLFIILISVIRPQWIPALPDEALIYRREDGSSGHASLLAVLLISIAIGIAWNHLHDPFMAWMEGRAYSSPMDERVVFSTSVAAGAAYLIASVNRLFKLGCLSPLAENAIFALIPPLILIFLVLGTIFIGVATPTEGGAMGATGALVMAVYRRRLSWKLFYQALDQTTLLTCFVMLIAVGASIFSFTFNAADGRFWIEHLFDKLPGGELGFLLFVNLLVFVLGMFIDYFEIAFIIIPILVPVAESMNIDLVWFGVLIAMNLQCSFLTPPFGYALFYLRSVAPKQDYIDRTTGRRIGKITTGQIYKGSVVFIFLQLIMVGVVMMFPGLVLNNLGQHVTLESAQVQEQLDELFETSTEGYGEPQW